MDTQKKQAQQNGPIQAPAQSDPKGFTQPARKLSEAIAALRAKENEGERIGTEEHGYNLEKDLKGPSPSSRKILEVLERTLAAPDPAPETLLRLIVAYLDSLDSVPSNAYFGNIETAARELRSELELRRYPIRVDGQEYGEVSGGVYAPPAPALAFSHDDQGQVSFIHIDAGAFDEAGRLGTRRVVVTGDDQRTYKAGWWWLIRAYNALKVAGFYQFPVACFDVS